MNQFKKYEQVVSRKTGKRGTVDKIEYDEFFRCLMYRVDMQGEKYHIEGKVYEGCYFWFKGNDLQTPADYNTERNAQAVA